jgi:Ca2+-binding EF-hand superfamily protein
MNTITTITLSTIIACLTLSAQETQPARRGDLAERFKALDRNGDGKVSDDQFLDLNLSNSQATRMEWEVRP